MSYPNAWGGRHNYLPTNVNVNKGRTQLRIAKISLRDLRVRATRRTTVGDGERKEAAIRDKGGRATKKNG